MALPLCPANRQREFVTYGKTRALFNPFVLLNGSVAVLVGRRVPMADYFDNRVFFDQLVNKFGQRRLLCIRPRVGRVPVLVKSANVTNAN